MIVYKKLSGLWLNFYIDIKLELNKFEHIGLYIACGTAGIFSVFFRIGNSPFHRQQDPPEKLCG